MDINRLRYFCTIAETGNMRRAAELLRVSPPALSKAVRLLQEEVGTKLIAHVGRNISLTEEGRRLVRRGSELLREVDRLKTEIETRASSANECEVRIATFEVFSTYFLSFLRELDWGDRPLVLHDVLPGELERLLKDGQADFGITYIPVPSPEVQYIKICPIEMGVFTSRGAFPGVKQQALPFVTPVMPVSGAPTRVRGLDGWPEDAYSRKVRYQVTLMESALELCRQGRAAGYFPRFVVEEHNARVRDEFKLVRRVSPYPGRVCTTDVFMVRRRGDPETRTLQQLARGIRQVCGRRR